MQEHIYSAKRGRIIRQSAFIWLFAALHIAANIMTVPVLLRNNQLAAILLMNVLFSLITVPAIILFFKYYKHSVGKKFIVTYNSLKYTDDRTGQSVELKSSEIDKIHLVENSKMSRFPWLFHEYFSFVDTKNNRIIITSYFMDISDFWLDTLTRKVSSNKLTREEKAYPLF